MQANKSNENVDNKEARLFLQIMGERLTEKFLKQFNNQKFQTLYTIAFLYK